MIAWYMSTLHLVSLTLIHISRIPAYRFCVLVFVSQFYAVAMRARLVDQCVVL